MLHEKELKEIIDIGISLTTQKDKNRLLEMILEKAMEISNCDAGTLYLYRGGRLEFKIMKTLSLHVSRGENGEETDLPPVPMTEAHVCAYAAIHKELVNIEDIYQSERFAFSDSKKYDEITGYRTRSMIVIPMEDVEGALVGVLQLVNAMDCEGRSIPFGEEDEFVLRSLASQAAVSISNMFYVSELKQQLYSFAAALATAIDERTPYNGSHTRMVTVYAEILADYINQMYARGQCEYYFDENRKEQLVLAAALHDIGKMVVPLSVMNKTSRLDGHLKEVTDRYRLLEAYCEIDVLKGRITEMEYRQRKEYLSESLDIILSVDKSGNLSEETLLKIQEIAAHVYQKEDGGTIPYLTEYERECLSVRRGTLTKKERALMEEHVIMTKKILDKVHFQASYANVVKFAASHHEMLNGSGYPQHLKGGEIEPEVRILAIVDIYDALTSRYRPYKKAISQEEAFVVLHSMAAEGKLEERLVGWLEDALCSTDIEKWMEFAKYSQERFEL